DTRQLRVVVQTALQVRVDVLNLIGVRDIEPSVLDSDGRTPVIVRGEGFSPFAEVYCRFTRDANSARPAVFIDDKTLRCESPVTSSTGGQCDAVQFNVIIGNRTTDTSNVPIRQPTSATLIEVVTENGDRGYGDARVATRVTLHGFGFVASPWATCAMRSLASGAVLWRTPATVQSNSIATCTQPPGRESPLPSALFYSHDGSVFGTSRVTYAMIGLPTALAIRGVASNIVTSGAVAAVPRIEVHVVDAEGNSLRRLDAARTRTVLVATTLAGDGEYARYALKNESDATRLTRNGVANFSGISLTAPKVGTLTLYFTDLTSSINFALLELTVVVGRPSKIVVREVTSGNVGSWRVGVR
ncbi:MAG: IPT/TIG domain-containing protein, partial [Ignavibacteria bacterium]|nr:IPT/TIG domain-containing protein [Ignavibacteria bacterium]